MTLNEWLGFAGLCFSLISAIVGCTFWIVKTVTALRADVQAMSEHEGRQDAKLAEHAERLTEHHSRLSVLEAVGGG